MKKKMLCVNLACREKSTQHDVADRLITSISIVSTSVWILDHPWQCFLRAVVFVNRNILKLSSHFMWKIVQKADQFAAHVFQAYVTIIHYFHSNTNEFISCIFSQYKHNVFLSFCSQSKSIPPQIKIVFLCYCQILFWSSSDKYKTYMHLA